ncbi:DUF2516 family protein [Streptomyces sp. ET3-23]|uniref:DUF2516 family protein n=1 Tax=Streptomyces sp. ET3-23 TaxID=2885643 RepID=UPI001D11AD57|nr:DUF2516 family protein [Streptomyces sp. ET3-23]MCC2278592.1 DUF2516 family protein [Streptomyces sp. ET3-23]
MLVEGFNEILYWVSVGLLLFTVAAFIDAAVRREDAYRAADKHTKGFWLIILGIAVAVNLFLGIMSFLPILGLIATIVYFVDVRPALKQVSGGRGPRRRGSSSDGPYGPWNGGR